MARTAPHVISARLSANQLARVRKAAEARHESIAVFTAAAVDARARRDYEAAAHIDRQRLAEIQSRAGLVQTTLLMLAANPNAPSADVTLAALIDALGLPPGSSPDAVLQAATDFIAGLAPEGDPLASDPEPAPAQFSAERFAQIAAGDQRRIDAMANALRDGKSMAQLSAAGASERPSLTKTQANELIELSGQGRFVTDTPAKARLLGEARRVSRSKPEAFARDAQGNPIVNPHTKAK